MIMDGWLKLHRKMLNWKWFSEPNTLAVFIYFLLKANTEDEICDSLMVRTGELITSRREIAKATGLSEQMVRTAITHLLSTQEITIKSTKQSTKSNSLVTITNYANYQNNFKGSQPRKQPSNQPRNQPTHNNILDTLFNNSLEEEQNKKDISSLNSSDIEKCPSLFNDENFNTEKKETERDIYFKKYQGFLVELPKNWPHVCKVRDQLTFEQFYSIRKVYSYEEIRDCLNELNDWPDFAKKRNTVYRSLLTELKKRYGERSSKMG